MTEQDHNAVKEKRRLYKKSPTAAQKAALNEKDKA